MKMTMRTILFPLVLFLLMIATFGCNSNSPADAEVMTTPVVNDTAINTDSIEFSFVFVGCNRIDGGDVDSPNTNASTANLPELQRTFTEVSNLNPKPVFFFFLGDEVLGLTTKLKDLQKELKAWRKQYEDTLFSPISASGIKMIAIPGNHEMLYHAKHKEELPNKGSLDVWMKEMNSFMPDSVNHVAGHRHDSLNNLMTYSFTYGNTHFIMINTDTYNKGDTIGMAPAEWIKEDIKAARKKKHIKHIFLLGHKPAVVSKKLYKDTSEGVMNESVIKIIWPAMDSNKAEAMLSAHSHQYNRIQPDSGYAYQIIAGNGGSRYEGHIGSIEHQFFGYTIVYVMKNHNVIVQSMGRTVAADNYLRSLTPADSTTVRDKVNITWGTNAGNYQVPASK